MSSARLRVITAVMLLMQCQTIVRAADGKPAATIARSPSYVVALSPGRPIVIAEESLTLEIKELKDSRCPAEAKCVWAGHASVTLQVSKPGSSTETVVIGTKSPPSMKLPYEATYANYLLHLEALVPRRSVAAKPAATPIATVRVSKL